MQWTKVWLWSALGLAIVAGPVHAQQGPATVLVIDGSGSMAGWLDGAKASKIDMARATLTPVLAKLAPQSALGLVAFGHRRKGNCTDVEAIVAPEPGGLEKTVAALPSVATTGKGPLVMGLKQAVQSLPASAAKRSIVLVHDDPDNCNQDVCAAAREIAANAPGLAVHVITLGNKPQTRAAMACLASLTGGRQFDAADDAALGVALDEAFKLAMLDNVPAPKPAVRPDAPEAKLPGSGLILTTSLASGGDAVADRVRWQILADGAADAVPVRGEAPELVQALPAGRYIVEASLGLAKASQTIDVADGKPTVARLDLNAGRIVLTRDPGTAGNSLITVTKLEPDRQTVYVGRTPETSLALPAGQYDIRVDDGLTRHTHTVAVSAAADTAIERPAPAGRLELEAVSAVNGPALDGVTYTIERDDPDAPQGRREVARSAAPKPDFTLPAGTYYVLARAKQVEVRQQLAVSSGSTVRETLVLALARLSLSAKTSATLSSQAPSLVFRVVSLGGDEQEVARSAAEAPVLTVPAGRYRVEAKLGSENAKAVVETELGPGKDAQLALDIPAGVVKLENGGRPDAILDVVDARGQVIWHAGSGETSTALLAPGRYTYRGPDGADKAFEVKNGETQTLKVNLN